ncbi:MON1 [Candida pseudojiufengensis]|uniref:MON1 n=1 Tax=Candida pseudojiufengensis TaxID=497109 RepID=UPI002224CB30|nr:MON1 [Candida pseudojiufengensis]KAI5962143.1 MON1 [Candida pseudojiufengensis]
MVESTLIYRYDALPLCGSVDDDNDTNSQSLLDQKKKCKILISRITPNSEPQATIESGDYNIHYLISQNIIYLCICKRTYPRKLAFSYLNEISNEFYNSHGIEALNPQARPFGFSSFDNFLIKTKKIYQDQRAQSNLDKLNNDLADVKKVMTKNIEDLLYRGDSLDKMSDLSSSLKQDSLKYRRRAQRINLEALIKQYIPIIATKSTSLLPKASNSQVQSTTEATTAINYENVNSEIQSIRNVSPLTQADNSSITSELYLSEYIEDLPLPNSIRQRQLNKNGGIISYTDLYNNNEEEVINKEEYFNTHVAISKTNDDNEFRSKLKHFFIFSTAGKPIYSMNGSEDVIIGYMGILTTILSTFQENLQENLNVIQLGNELKLIALNKAPIVLVAISKLSHETENFIKDQLEILYNYILSILSKPTIDKQFHNRLNYDLRRVLNPLDFENLDKLSIQLTYGLEGGFELYLSKLLQARQSFRIKYTLRTKMKKLLKNFKDEDLLFTILAKSNIILEIINHKIHELINEDLEMLIFIVNSSKIEGEDLWMPLCMPNFNKNGFLYIFVRSWNNLILILISGNKNSFYKLKNLANEIFNKIQTTQNQELWKNYQTDLLTPLSSSIPFVVKHFIYVNKTLNQFITSEFPQNDNDQILQMIKYYTTLKNNKSNLKTSKDSKLNYKKLSYLKWENIIVYQL